MSHNLMSENSMFSYKEIPWHRLGIVSDKEMGAQEALGCIESPYYEKRPVTVELDGQKVEYGDYAIIRSAIPNDPQERVVGTVKKNYNILQPIDIASKFDEEVNQPLETLGFLGTHGDKMFLTWSLPDFVVGKDDRVKLFSFVAAGYDGKFGASLNIVTVRVVCQNTFSMAVNESENGDKRKGTGRVWSGRHNSNTLERDLGIWMHHVQERALNQGKKASDIFNVMAATAIKNQNTLNNLLGKIYPDPKSLPANYPERLKAEKQSKIYDLTVKAERDRNLVLDLFNGAGIACSDGTVWSLFNATTQYENFGRVTKKPSDYSILFGNRANTMNRAFETLYAFVERNK